MKLLCFATALALASPALSQTGIQPAGSPAFSAPPCAAQAMCPQLAQAVARQNGSYAVAPGAMGGPYEPVASTSPARTAVAGSYPPCPRHDRTADSCIQLYERGVRTQ
jgi:hypothetical protein